MLHLAAHIDVLQQAPAGEGETAAQLHETLRRAHPYTNESKTRLGMTEKQQAKVREVAGKAKKAKKALLQAESAKMKQAQSTARMEQKLRWKLSMQRSKQKLR